MHFAKPAFKPQRLFRLDGTFTPFPGPAGWGQMCNSDAKGTDTLLDTSGSQPFGLGWIEFPPNGEVLLHTHAGSHILTCFRGGGKVVVEAWENDTSKLIDHELTVGLCYNIESMVAHSVHAGPEGLLLLVVGNDYRHATSDKRLDMTNPQIERQ